MKRTVKDLVGLKGKVVLLRVDFNVPIDENGKILDTTRIINALPTIKYLSKQQAKIVIMSHLGRPNGYEIHKSLWPVAIFLQKILKCGVGFCNSLCDQTAVDRIKMLQPGNVLILENTRFFEGEETCDKNLSKKIADMGDIFVNDAFGCAHRKNATTFGVPRLMPNAIGLLMEKEINALGGSMERPRRPFVAIVGGAKVKSKIKILERFLEIADTIIIGGAMAYTFLKAKGVQVGESMVEEDSIGIATIIMEKAKELGKKILLPVDHICLYSQGKKRIVAEVKTMKGSMVGYDIGKETAKLYEKEIAHARQIIWNGPMGMFEEDRFAGGTFYVAQAVAKSKAYSVVGGGDTVAALNKFDLVKGINFVSTGGGATMEFLEQGTLPCIEIIQEKIV